jgi:hypothetical protein
MILCRRNGLRRAIVSISAGSWIIRKIRPIHDQCAAITTELVGARAMSGRRGGVPDGDGTDGCVGDGGDVFRINPPVGQVTTVTVEIVDDRGVIVNLRYLR